MKTSLFLERTRNADSVFEEKTGNQTLQLPRFGHRHLPMKVSVGENSEYVNLGDWITYFTYMFLMGKTSRLKIREVFIGINTVNKIIRKAGNKF
jgi:UDP-2,3-diacylglucosamine pyrophosphatase LpxH